MRDVIDLAREGNEIIREAAKWSPELAAACEVWKAIDLLRCIPLVPV